MEHEMSEERKYGRKIEERNETTEGGKKQTERCILLSARWFHAAGIRACKTAAQTLAAAMGTGYMLSWIGWKEALMQALLAGILSLLTSVAGLPELGDTKEERNKADMK